MNKIALALLIGFLITLGIMNYSDSVQADLAHNMVRFHVLANSDSDEDQALKRSVRDRIINGLKDQFVDMENIDATKEMIQNSIPQIEAIAADEIKKWGKDYSVVARLEMAPFPTKVYGNVTLPAGNYEALRVIIGEGKGANWWCVLFPPLCFVDGTHAEMPESSKQQLQSVLSKEEYDIITNGSQNGEIPVQMKFKVVEWWQASKLKIQLAFKSQ